MRVTFVIIAFAVCYLLVSSILTSARDPSIKADFDFSVKGDIVEFRLINPTGDTEDFKRYLTYFLNALVSVCQIEGSGRGFIVTRGPATCQDILASTVMYHQPQNMFGSAGDKVAIAMYSSRFQPTELDVNKMRLAASTHCEA